MAVLEIFLSAFITVLFEKLASGDLLIFALQEDIHTQLNKWRRTLIKTQALLSDAEEKQITDTAVKMWLEDLGDLAYDLDDLLDKISTEASMRRNLRAGAASTEHHQASSTSTKVNVMRFIPTCCTNLSFSPRSFMLDRKMRSEMDEISTRLDGIFNQKNGLDLKEINVKKKSNNRLTTSLVDESRVFGRENDKRVIVDMLLKDFNEEAIPQSEVFSVIPIFGMGGVGKTTLAQLVYNDDKVKDFFDLKLWVCVSEEFDVFMITKTMLESVAPGGSDSKDLNNLQVSLKEKLSKQRFLLVLDDVWNENYDDWDLLCGPLRAGALGSKIIVTTRHQRVASITSPVPAFHLNVLENEECLSLLAQHALGRIDFNAHPSLKEIGEAIVRNCKGLPLAAKTLGGLLRTDLSPKYWKEIMNSKIWNIENCGILPALRLSYNHLPSYLKQLFAYCSIFPKDYEFDMNELVLLWMAEGFLQQLKGEKALEELGYENFNELLSRSFFQRSSGSGSRFVMHDLMNDLAQVIAGKISFRLDSSIQSIVQNEFSEKARHSSFIRQKYEVFKKFNAFHGVKGLRTFLPLPICKTGGQDCYLSNMVLTDLLPKLQCLRVLSLSGYSIFEIPESIGNLKQLRYLNLSETLIKCLPESVTKLYNLQTLLLCRCRRLTKLPASIGNLINLRHLDCSGTDELREMPTGIGKLASLRTLSKIVLGETNGFQIKELRTIPDIRGTLKMLGLHNVRNIQDAREANLLSKHGLDEVVMEWSESFDDSRNKSLEKEVLNILQPRRNLKKLKIISYGGTEFPRWIGDTSFSNIVNLELRRCRECTSLPSLGLLPSLKNLYISGIHQLKTVADEFYGADSALIVAFRSLETLTFQDMPNWEEWSTLTGVEVFPCLRELKILGCPSLIKVSLPRLPSLRLLKLEKCPEVVLRCMVGIASLTSLTVQGILGLTGLQKNITEFFGALENLSIEACSEMTSLWQEEEGAWKSLTNLRKLKVWHCKQLVSLTGEAGALPQNLEFLSLERCPNLEKLPSSLNNLTSLQNFRISDCPRIACLPETGLPPMLTRLEIEGCEALDVQTCNYEGMVMQSNNTINFSHLQILKIDGCSSLTSLPIGNLPSNLKELSVSYCKVLEPGVEKALHHCMSSLESLDIHDWVNFKTFPEFLHLTRLNIWNCPGLESFPERGLPLNLRTLEIVDCENLKLLPDQMESLTSLEGLTIHGCPSLNSFPQGGFPLNLKKLRIIDCENLKLLPHQMQSLTSLQIGGCPSINSFPKGGLPTNLKWLWLGDIGVPITEWGLQSVSSLDSFTIGCRKVVCFPGECRLPTSLRHLHINGAENLESVSDGLQNLLSLEELTIGDCPKLQSLPKEVLSTLSFLRIGRCPLQRFLKERRESWQPIPCVQIEGENWTWHMRPVSASHPFVTQKFFVFGLT